MAKKSLTSLELRKLVVQLSNEDKLSIRDSSKTVGKSKSVIHCILRKLEETVSCEGKGKLLQWKTDWLVKDRFATATATSKRANANLGIKTSRHTISRRLNEINMNSWVASTKTYFSKKDKMSRLKFATEHIIWTEEQWDCVPFIDEWWV